MSKSNKDQIKDISLSKQYKDRIKELEAEGLTTSAAQSVADLEKISARTEKGGWAILSGKHEGHYYIYHNDCYQSLKATREVCKKLGLFASIKNIQDGTFKNKNGKACFKIKA